MRPILRAAGAAGAAALTAVLSAALAVVLCGRIVAATPGAAAPDFSRTDFAGDPVHLAAYRGKVVLLNFWASWCAPCLEEMPRFYAWQRTYGARGLQIIGVSMDDDPASARRFLARQPAPYPVVAGDAELGQAFGGVLGLPLTLLIDSRGRVAGRYQGSADLAKIEARFTALLRDRPGTAAD